MDQQIELSRKLAMARRHLANNDHREAARLYRQVLVIDEGNVTANYAMGSRLLEVKRDGLARKYLKKVIAREPDHFQARLRLIEIASNLGEREKLSGMLQEMVASTTENDQLIELSSTMRKAAMLAPAVETYKRCLEIDPAQYLVHQNLGALYGELGEFELAEQHLREATNLAPERVGAYCLLAYLDKINAGSRDSDAIEQLYHNQQSLDDMERVDLNYALGRVLERGGDTRGAFGHYLEANNLQAGITPYSAEQNRKRFDGIRDAFSKEFFLDNLLVSSDSKTPIFIVGMPGSGTSLVEQILSAHPQVFGAGELDDFDAFVHRVQAIRSMPFYEGVDSYLPSVFKKMSARYLSRIGSLSAGAERVIDNTPRNFLYVGLITLVFPHAKIIHCRRNPVDTCLSIYTNAFSPSSPYSHDLSNLGHYYGDYAKLMKHWHGVLPFRIYDVQYEQLVADSEEEIRALTTFCELPFDPACLNFHNTKRAVSTASMVRVRRAIYQDSVQRWRRFSTDLTPLLEALREEGVVAVDGADAGVEN